MEAVPASYLFSVRYQLQTESVGLAVPIRSQLWSGHALGLALRPARV